jgi:hypothetical protein
MRVMALGDTIDKDPGWGSGQYASTVAISMARSHSVTTTSTLGRPSPVGLGGASAERHDHGVPVPVPWPDGPLSCPTGTPPMVRRSSRLAPSTISTPAY